MFLHLSVILFTGGGGIPACIADGNPACLAAALGGGGGVVSQHCLAHTWGEVEGSGLGKSPGSTPG